MASTASEVRLAAVGVRTRRTVGASTADVVRRHPSSNRSTRRPIAIRSIARKPIFQSISIDSA